MNLVISSIGCHSATLYYCHFSPSIYRQWVHREHNSSYNFIPIYLKLWTCFLHSLKMCFCFSYNPCQFLSLFQHSTAKNEINLFNFWLWFLYFCSSRCDAAFREILVEKLPPSYLPYRFLHNLHSFLLLGKWDFKKPHNKTMTRIKLFMHR